YPRGRHSRSFATHVVANSTYDYFWTTAIRKWCVISEQVADMCADEPKHTSAVVDESASATSFGGRRSRRIPFEMPVGIFVPQRNEEPLFEMGRTLMVNAHGALLAF